MPLLRDPLAALRIVARDPSCRDMLPLRDGRLMSALDIQRFYYERADAYLDEFGSTDEKDALMDAWDETLLALEHDPMRLRDRVDWVIKKRALDTYLGATGLSWEQAAADQAAVRGLQAYDLRFHDISRNGLYSQFFSPDTLITPEEIERAQRQPPPYIRARMRGEAIIRARQWQIPVTIEKWTELVLQGKKIEMLDPLEFDHPDVPFSDQPSVPLQQETGVRATPSAQSALSQEDSPGCIPLRPIRILCCAGVLLPIRAGITARRRWLSYGRWYSMIQRKPSVWLRSRHWVR